MAVVALARAGADPRHPRRALGHPERDDARTHAARAARPRGAHRRQSRPRAAARRARLRRGDRALSGGRVRRVRYLRRRARPLAAGAVGRNLPAGALRAALLARARGLRAAWAPALGLAAGAGAADRWAAATGCARTPRALFLPAPATRAPVAGACGALGRRREQRAAFLEREGLGVAVLGYLGVLLAIGDVRAVAAVEHLDAFGGEVLDDAIGVRFLFQAYHLARPLERHGVRVVLLQRGVLAAVLHVRAETPDVGEDGFPVRGFPERARQLEQLHGVGERDRIHLLPRAQAREARLLLIVLGADLHERAVAAHAHGDRLAGGGVPAELARLRRLLARDGALDLLDLMDERLPELVERRGPLFLAARHRVQLVLHRRGEAVLDVAMEVMGEEAVDDLADVGRHEAPAVHLDVFAILQRGDDARIGRGAADAVLLQRLDQ